MSPRSRARRVSSWVGWLLAGVLLVVSLLMWFERQWVVDTIQYHQFRPTKQIASITKRLGLTDDAKFTFYASHPSIENSDTFNQHCKRQEANSPILGCYSNGSIYLYDITDQRLDGIEEVTAAHELLHAEYERLSDSEKSKIAPLLQEAYDNLADDELKKRMDYYDRTQPGETYNELHSIVATEFSEISDELEQYYKRYFTDRQSIVRLHSQVDAQFSELSEEANTLVKRINNLTRTINSETRQYNEGVASLNGSVASFNARAETPGGFASQGAFEAERAALEAERQRLENLRQRITGNITTYKSLVAQLEAINTQAASLNASIDSVLAEEPRL